MAIDVRAKTQEVVDTIDNPAFLQQIEDSLPEGVSLHRFVSVAKTAVRTNPDLATADQTSLFGSIVRCAQDGLLPDGREAALVIYKGKVGYLAMIGGIRRIAAAYGWTIRTAVVYANDEFDYVAGSPPMHRPVRPGMDRGDMIAAYAVATHRDGRTLESVLTLEDINKRRAKAQTQAVWNEWPGPMAEKTAGHDIFGQLSLDPADARVDRILREGILADPLQALYGVKKTDELRAAPEPSPDPDGQGSPISAKLEEAARTDGAASAASSPEPEDGVWEPVDDEPEFDEAAVEAAAQTVVSKGVHKDSTFAQVAEDENGPTWFLSQLKRIPEDAPARTVIDLFVQARLPDTWAIYVTWKESQ